MTALFDQHPVYTAETVPEKCRRDVKFRVQMILTIYAESAK